MLVLGSEVEVGSCRGGEEEPLVRTFESYVNGQTARHLELRLPEPLLNLTRSCEVFCVAGCCGPDAFDVQASHLAAWVQEHGIASAIDALHQLETLANEASAQDGAVWSD